MIDLNAQKMKAARQAIIDGLRQEPGMTLPRVADLARPFIVTDGDMSWLLTDNKNIVMGAEMTSALRDLLAEMIEKHDIYCHFSSPLAYMQDGRCLNLPLVALNPHGLNANEPNWMPIVFTLEDEPPENPKEVYKNSIIASEAMKRDAAVVLMER